MAWKKPKTDWVNTDRFNIEDYNRIKGNLEYLRDKAAELLPAFELLDMGEDKSDYADFFYSDEFNLFEKNLEIANRYTFLQDYGESQTFFDNGPFIKWDELNRIESAILRIYTDLENQYYGRRMFTFMFGTRRLF